MYILGIGGSNHDFSSCLMEDNIIRMMIEDERITRDKHGLGLGVSLSQGFSRKYCLNNSGLELKDIDLIVSNDIINQAALFRLKNVQLINHHKAHAASAFFCSPFKESAILVCDAVGSKHYINGNSEYESLSYMHGESNKINTMKSITGVNLSGSDYIENSLGIFYAIITDIIGFGELQEGKTMGLAPYGSNGMLAKVQNCVSYDSDGNFYLSEQNIRTLLSYKEEINHIKDENKKFSLKADFAWAAQTILEECLINACKYLKKLTQSDNLCLAGGVILNSVANYKIYKSKIFKNIFIQPAAGDNGTSVGSAMYGYYSIMNQSRK